MKTYNCSCGVAYVLVDLTDPPDQNNLAYLSNYWPYFKWACYDDWFGEYIGNNDAYCRHCDVRLPDEL